MSLKFAVLLSFLSAVQLPDVCIGQSTPQPIPVSSVAYRGASLQVMQYGTLRFVEPFIAVSPDACVPSVAFDYIAFRYALRVPLILDAAGLPGTTAFAPIQIDVTARGANTTALAGVDCSLNRPTDATLAIWCDTFDRCQAVRWALVSSQRALAASMLLTVRGLLGGQQGELVTLTGRQLQTLPLPTAANSCGTGWILFHQRVDGSLSFQQNWDTYVRGFGSPDSNYWMGLERISAETLHSQSRAHCMLRVEVVDVYGTLYWAETTSFQVLTATSGYSFFSPVPISSGSLQSLIFYHHTGFQFLTYDRDSTICSGGCSRIYGHSGWWHNPANFRFNLNAMYTDKFFSTSMNGGNQAMVASGTLLDVKTSKMLYKCL